jgi:hypothetical protein
MSVTLRWLWAERSHLIHGELEPLAICVLCGRVGGCGGDQAQLG